jgi:hypothetical protein
MSTRCELCGDTLDPMARPRKYCDTYCRKAAEHERTRTPERLAEMRETKRRRTEQQEASMPGLWRKRRSRAISKGLHVRHRERRP